MDMLQAIAHNFAQVQARKPLIHQITNFVTVNDCANVTLAIGASPVMANDPAEVEEIVACASALVLNIGALNIRLVDAMIAAGQKAATLGIPIVLDPVGVGATTLRTQAAERIIREVPLAVIRGNISEIAMLSGYNAGIKGVDSIAPEQDSEKVAQHLSKRIGCVVAVTGRTDIIVQDNKICRIYNGHPMLARVTGTGCMATALVGSCSAVADPFVGAAAGITIMGIAGELAQQSLKAEEGVGTFRKKLFDAIGNMTPDRILRYAKVDM
jgi:hydroxyethylthiazole kinase